jgi:hypothetical protein
MITPTAPDKQDENFQNEVRRTNFADNLFEGRSQELKIDALDLPLD